MFGDDRAGLEQLAMTIDEAAIEHCPVERNELLSVLQLTSLQEAARSVSNGRADPRAEHVNDFAAPGVIYLVCRVAVVRWCWWSPWVAG